jgi:hypothetical protein
MSKGLVVGFSLCLLALLLGGLFFIKSYHEAYWSSPAVFISITLLGTLSPLLGGLLVGNRLAANRGSTAGTLQRFLFSGGFVVSVAGVFLAISALGMALTVSNTGYWGHPPYDYEGDYVIMRLQIDLFRFAILPELVGGLMLGAALRMGKAK